MSFARDFKKTYDRETGRKRLQKWDGGVFLDSMKQVTPEILGSGVTGRGKQLRKHAIIETVGKSAEEEATHIGEEILNRLKIRSGSGVKPQGNIESRIKNLIQGSGMQIM